MLQIAKKTKGDLDILVDMVPGMIVQGMKEIRKTNIINKTFGKIYRNKPDLQVPDEISLTPSNFLLHLFSVHNWDRSNKAYHEMRKAHLINAATQGGDVSLTSAAPTFQSGDLKEFDRKISLKIALDTSKNMQLDTYGINLLGKLDEQKYRSLENNLRMTIGENAATSVFAEFTFNALIEAYLKAASDVSLINAKDVTMTKLEAVQEIFQNLDTTYNSDEKYNITYRLDARKDVKRHYMSDGSAIIVTPDHLDSTKGRVRQNLSLRKKQKKLHHSLTVSVLTSVMS